MRLFGVVGVLVACVASAACPERDDGAGNRVSTDCRRLEPDNPYADGSGHHAGFEWAERVEPSSCGGNSTSFIEGCREFQRQAQALAACQAGR